VHCHNTPKLYTDMSDTQPWDKLNCDNDQLTRNPAIAEGPRDAGVPVEIS